MIKFMRPTRGKVRPSYKGSRGDLLKLGPALKLQGRNSLLSLEAGIVQRSLRLAAFFLVEVSLKVEHQREPGSDLEGRKHKAGSLMAGSPVTVSFRNNKNITHTFIKSSSIEKIKMKCNNSQPIPSDISRG